MQPLSDSAVHSPTSLSSSSRKEAPHNNDAKTVDDSSATQNDYVASSSFAMVEGFAVDGEEEKQEDDDDSDLRAALALSLQTFEEEMSANRKLGANTSGFATHLPAPAHNRSRSPDFFREVWEGVEPFDVADFHEIMWDASTTTEEDKLRWISEAIRTWDVAAKVKSEPLPSAKDLSMLSQLVQSENPTWGLSQHFGGPCGVLAAVQAEMLRILIWGSTKTAGGCMIVETDPKECPDISAGIDLEVPDTPQQQLSGLKLDSHIVRVATARAIATILTRAALQKPASIGEDCQPGLNSIQYEAGAVRVVLPVFSDHRDSRAAAEVLVQDQRFTSSFLTPSVSWSDLEPALSFEHAETSTSCLKVCTVRMKSDCSEMTDWSKRQKTETNHSTTLSERNQHDKASKEQHNEAISLLARKVGDFLLQQCHGSLAPVDYFFREGGVLLFVMSLVCSRGKERIKADFDDLAGCKLTAQFGHCSQELINLLLSGQAVSNVFDHNLSPDKGIMCRGIQQQSSIGYLTQLESLRYCQVGSFYKSPVFPIWVIGSTSHFTVIFGDEKAVWESKSDRLLEECRRAFKAVEVGDDCGFIAADKLSAVLQMLDLQVQGAEEVIASSIEVPGAGIILWQDFWRVVSQLLAGSSVESVLNSDWGHGRSNEKAEGTNKDIANSTMPPLIPFSQQTAVPSNHNFLTESATEIEHLSDEALARKLQAEWDAEYDESGASDRAASGSPLTLTDDEWATKPAASSENLGDTLLHKSSEQDIDSFILYHYNGLRGGKLVSFCITRLHPEEAVGGSVAINHTSSGIHAGGHGGLGDIIRTRWPTCTINWIGQTSMPEID